MTTLLSNTTNIDAGVDGMIKQSTIRLYEYCKQNNWAGYDPYDSLNSKFFKMLPILNRRLPRLLMLQAVKRIPINLRPLLLVPKAQNPKGLALFSSALLKLNHYKVIHNNELAEIVLQQMIKLRSPGQKDYCWGYHFDWQSRYFFLPKFHPNIVCTTFAGHALLDVYEQYHHSRYLEMAVSAGNFILTGLNIVKDKNGICFSYTPLDKTQVHNANLLGAAFLARLYKHTGENTFLDPARQSAAFSVQKQAADGSWPYGEDSRQKWIDNFHTGYNLIALEQFSQYSGNREFQISLEKGYRFYLDHFITAEGIAKYYHDRIYPIDIHSVAQTIITLVKLQHLDGDSVELALKVCRWALQHMQNKSGYFYFQKKQYVTDKVPYIRWSQAWMLYAFAALLGYENNNNK